MATFLLMRYNKEFIKTMVLLYNYLSTNKYQYLFTFTKNGTKKNGTNIN